MIINENLANKFADPNCEMGCDGTGIVVVNELLDEEYCICVTMAKIDEDGDKLSDQSREK